MSDLVIKLGKLAIEVDFWLKKIEQSIAGFKGYETWRKNHNIISKIGIGRGMVYGCRKELFELSEQAKNNFIDENFDFDMDKEVFRAKVFIPIAKQYISSLTHPLANKTWFFYFLEVGNTKYDFYPRLGRGLLKTYEKFQAKLNNVPDAFSRDYEGEYHTITDNVIFFDLNTKGYKKRLHIKIRFEHPDDEIQLGTYSTFDRSRVVSGSVLLEQITSKELSDEEIKPLLVSSIDEPKKFKEINSSIRRYLESKSKNYYKVSNSIINLDTLENYIKSLDHPKEEDIENRFLELERPIVFISTPQTALDKNQSIIVEDTPNKKSIIQKLKDKFQNLEIKYENTDVFQNNGINDPYRNLKLLQRSRYFIIILAKADTMSFSLIQLGWAIIYCKHVLVLYEDGAISSRLQTLEAVNTNIKCKTISKINGSEDEIYIEISQFIINNQLDKKRVEY